MLGGQEARVELVPRMEWTPGDDLAAFGASYGMNPDPWQLAVLSAWLGEGKTGKLVAGRAGLAVPRQNGKNAVLEIVELYKTVAQGRKILHTAHEVKTARQHFLRMKAYFDNPREWPELVELVANIRQTNGQEQILLKNGGQIQFIARSKSSGRGFTVDDLVCDEAQELTDEQLDALLPTISAAPSGDPQQIYTGTPPGPQAAGDVFTRIRKDGCNPKSSRLVWHEWSIPDESPKIFKQIVAAKDGDAEALEAVLEHAEDTNPAVGLRLNMQTVKDELGAMSPEGFARERLGKWDVAVAGEKALRYAYWRRLTVGVEEAPKVGRVVYCVRFSVDGQIAALGAARKPHSGPIHVEGVQVFDMTMGIRPVVDFLVARADTAAHIVVDGFSGADLLVQALRDRGVKNKRLIVRMSAGGVTAACAEFKQALVDMSLTHIGQDALNRQVRIAEPRKVGNYGGFGWAAPAGESVALLEAVTYAFAQVKNTRRRVGVQ